MVKKIMTGNVAATRRKISRQVIAAYPITPQTSIVEKLAQLVSNGDLKQNISMWNLSILQWLHIAASQTGAELYCHLSQDWY